MKRFVLQIDYQYQAAVDGTVVDANGLTSELMYRDGSTVTTVFLERVQGKDDPTELGELGHTETLAAVQTAIERLRNG